MAANFEDQKSAESISRSSSTSSGIESSCLPSPTHVTFSCDCGKCTLVSYLKGDRDCPSGTVPSITVLTHDPPFTDDFSITDNVMTYPTFQSYLNKGADKMRVRFCNFVFDTFKELSSINFDELKEYIFDLLAPQHIHKLTTIKDLNELRRYLKHNFISWFNYELILSIRQKFLHPEGTIDEVVRRYKLSFQEYTKQRCFLYSDNLGPSNPQIEQVEVTCKMDNLDFKELTHEQIKKKKLLLLQIMDILPFMGMVKQVREGCVESVLSIPAALTKNVALTAQKLRELKNNGFRDVRVKEDTYLKLTNFQSQQGHTHEVYISDSNFPIIYTNDEETSDQYTEKRDSITGNNEKKDQHRQLNSYSVDQVTNPLEFFDQKSSLKTCLLHSSEAINRVTKPLESGLRRRRQAHPMQKIQSLTYQKYLSVKKRPEIFANQWIQPSYQMYDQSMKKKKYAHRHGYSTLTAIFICELLLLIFLV